MLMVPERLLVAGGVREAVFGLAAFQHSAELASQHGTDLNRRAAGEACQSRRGVISRNKCLFRADLQPCSARNGTICVILSDASLAAIGGSEPENDRQRQSA